ncbi:MULTISPECIES: hypothetical protein [Pelosinus]|uniref:Uncharacterized protein n=1 Tax=Pelosinus fermentans B4 TaxID=1149862 RepID=I8RMC3_9FIRM|nr:MULTISPECIES: hypothetical protein [Pelosinus]EIW19960.1 hypothetical protein FB4_0211 [Pelosinus fermentans B4]EIW21183.1 hypothetical protein FA11_0910 [Pelosinus fermentans A11]
MGFKVITEITKTDGTEDKTTYTGTSFLTAVTTGQGVQLESKISSVHNGIAIIAAAVTAVGQAAKGNGHSLDDILSMIADGASNGVQQVLGVGHECTNCGKCGKKVN